MVAYNNTGKCKTSAVAFLVFSALLSHLLECSQIVPGYLGSPWFSKQLLRRLGSYFLPPPAAPPHSKLLLFKQMQIITTALAYECCYFICINAFTALLTAISIHFAALPWLQIKAGQIVSEPNFKIPTCTNSWCEQEGEQQQQQQLQTLIAPAVLDLTQCPSN